MLNLYQREKIPVDRGTISYKTIIFFTICNFWLQQVTAQQIDIVVQTNQPNAIQHALDQAPKDASPWIIFIPAGNYYEKITILRDNVTLIGEGKKSRLYFDAYAGQEKVDASGSWGTSGSATLTILGKNFTAKNLSVENSFDYPSNDRLEKDDPKKIKGTQAVAIKIDASSDKVLFDNVDIIGFQDTLYVNGGRSVFINGTISGHVDFIFGSGQALFINNSIITRERQAHVDPIGYLTAPSTNINQPYGLIFLKNRLIAEDNVMPNSMALGRPWHPTTQFPDGRYADPSAIGQSIFISNFLDRHIKQSPWYPMGGKLKDGTRTQFYPEEARFYEFQNCGPGAKQHNSRRQLDERTALQFSITNFLADWPLNLGIVANVCP